MRRLYGAYGSNLNVNQMQFRCEGAIPVGVATLKGYRLMYKGSLTGSYLTIEKDEKSVVPIGIWSITEEDEKRLDRYEGCPNFYYKTELQMDVEDFAGNVQRRGVIVYIMHENRLHGLPTESYVKTCNRGYRDFGFDTRYLVDSVKYTYNRIHHNNKYKIADVYWDDRKASNPEASWYGYASYFDNEEEYLEDDDYEAVLIRDIEEAENW